MVVGKLADIELLNPELPADLASILPGATESEVSALVKHAQQDSNLRPTD